MNDTPQSLRCTSCPRGLYTDEIAAGRYACRLCETRAFEALRAIPRLFGQINSFDALLKVSGPAATRSSSGREAPAPVRIPILSDTCDGGVVTELQAITDAWFTVLGFHHGRKLRPHEIVTAVTPLINNLRWACENYPEIATDIATITGIHSRLHAYTTGERGPRRFTVYCSTPDCDGGLRISLATSASSCPDCHTEYDKSELMHLRSEFDAQKRRAAA